MGYEKFGSDQSQIAGFGGAMQSEDGTVLLSDNSVGETALMMGPALTREVISGISNGDWAIGPQDPLATITDTNPVPYWSFTDTSSAGAITAAIVADSGSASGNALRFTIASGTTSGKAAQISRFFPIPSSKSRSLWQGIEVTLSNITSTANATITGKIEFYANDQSTQVFATPTTSVSTAARAATLATITTAAAHYLNTGDTVTIALTSGPTGYAALNGTYSITVTSTTQFTYTTTTSGTVTSGAAVGAINFPTDLAIPLNAITTSYPDNSIQIPNYISGGTTGKSGTPPPTAAYARAVIVISTVGTVSPAASIDINEVRNIRGFQEVIINDSTDPQSYAPMYINNSYGIATISNGATTSGQQAQILLTNGTGTGGTVTASTNLSVPALSAGSGNIGMGGSLYGSSSFTGPNMQLGGAGRLWAFSSSSGAADVIASNASTRAGILITKSVLGQPTTTVNGTGTTDAFADALRNGGIAADTTNNRAYFYSNGWKYAALTTPSDSRLKEEIKEISGALEMLRQLAPVAFKWKRPNAHNRSDAVNDDGTRMGFIADHVATTDLSHWVETLGVDDREADLIDTPDVLSVNIPQNEMEALVVQALLDIDARLKALENR